MLTKEASSASAPGRPRRPSKEGLHGVDSGAGGHDPSSPHSTPRHRRLRRDQDAPRAKGLGKDDIEIEIDIDTPRPRVVGKDSAEASAPLSEPKTPRTPREKAKAAQSARLPPDRSHRQPWFSEGDKSAASSGAATPRAATRVPSGKANGSASSSKPAAEEAAQCSTRGCTRDSWNGEPGESCCRTCEHSNMTQHGPACTRKFAQRAAAVGPGQPAAPTPGEAESSSRSTAQPAASQQQRPRRKATCVRMARQLLPSPPEDLPAGAFASAQNVFEEMIEGIQEPEEAERKNLLRDLLRKWHPDKNSEEEKEVVTAIFQYINSNRQIFLAGLPGQTEASL